MVQLRGMGLFDGKIPPNSIKFPWFIMVYRVVSHETLRKTVPRKWGVGKARNLIRRSDVPESGSGLRGLSGTHGGRGRVGLSFILLHVSSHLM